MPKLFFIILISLLSSNCSKNCNSFKNNPNAFYGIDISHYQNNKSPINWDSLSIENNPKISFVYIRTTMGKDGQDTAFKHNLRMAKKTGFKVGIYHYYRPNEKSNLQFENFKKHNLSIGDLPPVVDIEEKSILGSKYLLKEISNFLNLIEKHYGIKPIIYTPQRFYNTYLRNKFKEYEFWIARQNGYIDSPDNNQMKKEPVLFDTRCPLIWQYSGTGSVQGIKGNVDLNVIYKPIWDI
ncbi:MAG: glycoside hydrolase [Flavobacteriales bacterium]|jgi:lysozyme|nr:glycoside hydrolase [Flavobacteriales bacterium]|tara:strand:+ start:2025 stop:2738 length:714 start_codon:yes stop_codon:yes gene_type:complete